MAHRQDEPDWGEQLTEQIPVVDAPGGKAGRWSWRAVVPLAVLSVLAVVYLADLALSNGRIPRGTEVSGIRIGGLDRTAAERSLRGALAPQLGRAIAVRAGSVTTTVDPAAAGLQVDWAGTLDTAGAQPLNPFTRLSSFFGSRPVDIDTRVDPAALSDALDGINTLVHRDPTDGGITFDGSTPNAVRAAPGADLDIPGAAQVIAREWTSGLPVELPVLQTEPANKVTDAAVARTLDELARPAVAADVRVLGEGKQATISPHAIAEALSFVPDGSGGLEPVLDVPGLADVVTPQLASTEQPAKDASVTLAAGTPLVTPSVNGRGVDYQKTFADLVGVLGRADPTDRTVTAVYTDQPAKLTTDEVNTLGIKGVISKFSTGGFAQDSGQNIKRAAETINGKILRPGETFSLNDATGLRDAPQGYVPAGIIENGHPARGIGGGVSQLATTLYNAAYFAGMGDVAHQEHSYYISRYPPAREATVYEGAIDLKFRNDLPTGVLIQTIWTPADITVQFWGTQQYDVTSTPGPRTKPVPPQTLTLPAGQQCSPSAGGAGFTTTDTRTLRDVHTGKSTAHTRTVRYKPSPKVVCAGAAPPG